MRRTRKIRVLFAWLALIALSLTIVAPVVSRSLAGVTTNGAHGAHHGTNMSAQMGADDAHAQSAHTHVDTYSDHDGTLMEQCGYCGLLGHNPLLIVIAWLPGLLPQTPPRQLTRPSSQRGPEHSTLTAVPRGPPAFLHS
ncbi:hypothetical protein ACVWWQ_001029 [Rhodanobacter sp. TND4EL1]